MQERETLALLKDLHRPHFEVKKLREFNNTYPEICFKDLTYEETGDSIYHICARLDHSEALKFLLNLSKKDIDIKNKDGKTPLHEACQFSNYSSVCTLLEYGAEVNSIKRADWSPLMLACTKIGQNSHSIVKLLLKNYAITNLKNKDGWTALHLACRAGDENIVKTLLEKDKTSADIKSKNGRTVLHIAALHEFLKILEILISSTDINIDITDKSGNTALHEATKTGNLKIIKYLISKNCNYKKVNSIGWSILHIAANLGHRDVITYFINELKFEINILNDSNMTALHCAALNKNKDTIEFLLSLGADSNIMDKSGRTVYDYLKIK